MSGQSRDLKIAYGKSCGAKTWHNSTITWEELCGKLQTTLRTRETVEEYRRMTKIERGAAKDRGAFVGGRLRDGRRLVENVECRSLLSLDADNAEPGFIDRFAQECEYAAVLYTTHSHTPEVPRVRIVIPLAEDISPDCYVALSRLYAAMWGIDQFDECSYRVNQLMYWPTTPSDGEYVCRIVDGPFMDAMEFLEAYPDWRDCASLPRSSREEKLRANAGKKQEDPLTKEGIVGAFCRTYGIEAAIEKYLSDKYAPSALDGRYDYIPGEGTAGVIVYDDKFAYSHHATDPAGGRLLNAFDLVRRQRFPGADEKESFLKMCELASEDELVQETQRKESAERAKEDFASDETGWEEPLPLEDAELPAFPIDALPKTLGDYAAAIGRSTQTPVDMAAVSVLTVVSACMRNLYKVEGKADWLEPTNIYSVIIAEPSERKSAVLSMAVKPVNAFIKEYNEEHKVEFEMSKATKQRLENKKSSLLSQSRKKGEEKSAEEFNDALREVVEELVNFQEIKPLRIYVDDTTPEKLIETLGENDNAISIISTEGGIFDLLSGTYSNKVNIDVFLKAYSGESISVDRINRSSVAVDEACLTILLSVQPVVIGELMSNKKFRNRGLTARFLYTFPRSLVGSRDLDSAPMPPDVYAAYRDLIYNILRETREDGEQIIRLTPDAKERLASYYQWVEKRLAGEYSMYSDWLGKLVGNTLRIAGILARASTLRDDGILPENHPIVIDTAVMENAIRIGRYFLVHAVNAYGNMGVRSDCKSALMALDKVKQRGCKTITRRDIMRLCRWVGSAEEAQTILGALEDYGYVRLSSVDVSDKLRAGRPKNAVYTVNPYVYQ